MRALLLALMVSLGSVAPALAQPPAPADIDENDAEAVYQRGRQRFQAGDIQGALDDYRRSCEIECTWQRSANRGNAAYQLGLYAEAASAIQLAISRVSPADEDTRGKLGERLAQAQKRCSTLTLLVEPAGAELLVDGRSVGRAPFSEPVFVMPGLRKLEAVLGGKKAVAEKELAAGEEVELTLSVPLGATESKVAPPTGDDGDSALPLALGITGLALGAGGIVGGIVSLVVASGKGDDAAALRDQIAADPRAPRENPCGDGGVEVAGCPDLRSAVDAQATLQATGITLLVAGGVLAAAGVTALVWPSDGGADTGLVIGPGSLSLRGSF